MGRASTLHLRAIQKVVVIIETALTFHFKVRVEVCTVCLKRELKVYTTNNGTI